MIQNKPIFGIDIDDVLAQTARLALEEMKKLWFHSLDFHGLTEFDHSKIPGFPLDKDRLKQHYKNILLHSDSLENLQPLDGAQQGVEFLKERFRLIAITGRSSEVQQRTHEWIEKYFPNMFSDVFFLGTIEHGYEQVDKGLKLQQLGAVWMIEDAPLYAQTIIRENINCILMERPWNTSFHTNHPNLHRITHWWEIVPTIATVFS